MYKCIIFLKKLIVFPINFHKFKLANVNTHLKLGILFLASNNSCLKPFAK